jgi:antitoxin component YwqK of YwqJK toxin-antitoxin module
MKELINQYDEQGERHGSWVGLDSAFRLIYKANYFHGKVHGVYEDYYFNGTLELRAHYHHGKLHGVYEEYYNNGAFRWIRRFRYGNLEGLEKKTTSYRRPVHKSYQLIIR